MSKKNTVPENQEPNEAATITAEAAILQSIREEQKYVLMLLSVLNEQLAEFDIGKKPDYSLMLEVMSHTNKFSERFNHKVKEKFIQKIIDKTPEGNPALENLLAEQKHVVELGKEVVASLKALLKEESILREEQLKIFSKNFVELLENHIETEKRYVLDTDLPLSEKEIHKYSQKLNQDEEQSLTTLVEERYKDISKQFNHGLDDLEGAASNFAFSEFIGISALFDAIEPLSIGIYDVSHIIKELSYQIYLDNLNCYKNLLSEKPAKNSDYFKQPMDSMIKSYKDYVDGLTKIGNVVQKTRDEISKPYQHRKDFFNSPKK